ncbi:hypothetical protein, partial [Roseateles terrae]|uniref:hypothetical protein n=1 Tax=Roseateles terrae TaxID=431060 RepID=UPI001C8549CE
LSADDSADSRVKVGHRQANNPANPLNSSSSGGFAFWVFEFDPSVDDTDQSKTPSPARAFASEVFVSD